jgi:hypothetical protein
VAWFRVWPLFVLILSMFLGAVSADAGEPVECWRGWGYRVDKQTRTYKSEEILLVTKGPADWRPGHRVVLYTHDRATGQIIPTVQPITIVLLNARSYYRNNLNYVDGEGEIAGSEDNMVFGLSHVPLPTAAIEKLHEYNVWACGLEGAAG